ncbi:MAG: adenylate/guanylate cyclase domain-containing protein [Candidatus Binataceae bacterium]
MHCSSCNADNPEGLKFCEQCGAPFKRRCAKCGFENSPAARFCGKCGAALSESAAPRPPSSAARIETPEPALRVRPEATDDIPEGERKTVTALFADIKGSMELMEDLDPEEARAIVDPALKLMIDAAHHYDGYIVQSTGDGVFALFGAPVAHEDHPQRALYAALRMQEEVKRYAEKLRAEKGVNVQVRVGVTTGEVVVRSIKTGDAHTEYTPIGHSISLASRLQALAAPGSIAISENVRELVEGYFVLKALGPARIKGVSEPVNVHEVTGLGPLRTRLQRSASRGLSKFVGRQAEMEAMKRALELTKAGHGQIVAAMAEAGVGKSRLFHEFKAIVRSGAAIAEAFSVSHGKASPYLPVIELLKSYFEITSEDDARRRREKVTGRLLTLDRTLGDALPHLFALLGIVEGEDPLAQMDAQIRRRRTFEALKRLVLRESFNQPVVIIFEDLHWIDSETQAFLNLLADGIANARVLMLLNYRPEYRHEWSNRTYYTQLRLDPLGRESADEMLTELLGDTPAIAPLKRLIADRTQGNPFFIEEMVRALFEEGALARKVEVQLVKPLDQIRVPATVQAVLAARIDRLAAEDKALLHTLAVLGTEFPLSLVKHVAGVPDQELERMLSDLQLAEFIFEQPALPEVEYVFKHALTQEVAYNSVLVGRRRLLHERVARAIEELYPDRLEDHLAELAHHYGRSANVAKALEYQRLAGQQAHRRFAHAEAIIHLTAALQLLKNLPDDEERARQELRLQLTLVEAATAITGPAADEVGAALTRARELCTRLGDTRRLFPVLLGLRFFYFFKSQWQNDLETSQQLVALAEREPQPSRLIWAHTMLGFSLYFHGRLGAARAHLEQAVALIPAIPERTSFAVEDPRTEALWTLGHVLWVLGFPDQALTQSQQAVALARKLGRPYPLATAYAAACILRGDRGDVAGVGEAANALATLAAEHGFALWTAQAMYWRGWCLVEKGMVEEGISEVQRALAGQRDVGSVSWVGTLREAYRRLGRFEEALAALEESEVRAPPLVASELRRTKAQLLLEAGRCSTREAEDQFREAIGTARGQGAKSYELRATTSLARLLAKQGRRDEARATLAEIYGWFTEGFDTADLKDAKALLDELGGTLA